MLFSGFDIHLRASYCKRDFLELVEVDSFNMFSESHEYIQSLEFQYHVIKVNNVEECSPQNSSECILYC